MKHKNAHVTSNLLVAFADAGNWKSLFFSPKISKISKISRLGPVLLAFEGEERLSGTGSRIVQAELIDWLKEGTV